MTVALMVDLSSNNATPNLREHYRAGYRVIALKVTEGTSYTWAASHGLSARWHALGGTVWHYHFLNPGDGATQADYFWQHVRDDLHAGDRVVCDVETKGETGAEVAAFWGRYITHDLKTPRVDYGSPYFLRDNNIRPQHGEALWIADYDVKPVFIPTGWKTWLAWQYTDRATSVPGIPGAVDQSHLAPAALPTPPAPPKPPPSTEEDDVRLYILTGTKPVWITNGLQRRWVQTPAELAQYERDFGIRPIVLPKGSTFLDDIPVVGPVPK